MRDREQLSGIAHRLSKKHTLFGSQFELLRRGFLVSVVEPGRQPLRSGKQIDVACDEARVGVVIGLLNLRVPDPAVGLAGPGVISGEINDIEDVKRSGRGCPSTRPTSQVSSYYGCQSVRNRFVQINSAGQCNVEIDFL